MTTATTTSSTRFVTSADGTPIAYDVTGEGPAVVVVEGALCHRAMGTAKSLTPLLSTHHAVFAYDRRGRGESGPAPGSPDVAREVEDLVAVLEVAGPGAFVVGASSGAALVLEAQDRTRWDQLLIRRGLAALRQAQVLAMRGRPVGKYFLQASIAAQHARAPRAEDTDWRQIARLYDVLAKAAPGPVVEVNRAVAHGRAFDPDDGLAVLAGLDGDQLGGSPLLPSVRGDLLERAGRNAEAAEAFSEAADRSRNEAERAVLRRRAEENLERMSKPG